MKPAIKPKVFATFRAALRYFAVVFGVGFILGLIRTLWLVPRLGARWAEVAEMPVMILVTVLAARWTILHFPFAPARTTRWGIGIIAFALLSGAELALAVGLRDMTVLEALTNRDPVSGAAYFIAAGLFAVMPVLVLRRLGRVHKHRTTIDDFIERADVAEVHETDVHAPADVVFDVAENFDLNAIPLVRAIFRLREVVFRVRPAAPIAEQSIVSQTLALGWGVLAYRAGRERVMGAVTQPWLGEVKFKAIPAGEFAAFSQPDAVKIVWTLEAEPHDPGLTRFRTQTRVLATDDTARRKFRRYWFFAGPFIILIRVLVNRRIRRDAERRVSAQRPLVRIVEAVSAAFQMGVQIACGPFLHAWRTRWGARSDEVHQAMPGDELIPHPDWSYNHAITINAPRMAVWPWLVQLGQKRGGFYSYEGLENAIGCDIHNVWTIHSELQGLKVGETVRTMAKRFGPSVTRIERGRSLVLGGVPDLQGSQATWSFYLLDGPNGTTRLLERGRCKKGRGIAAKLGFGPYLLDPIGFVMSRKMLRTIKRLAEREVSRTLRFVEGK